jgi:hypothetical protein
MTPVPPPSFRPWPESRRQLEALLSPSTEADPHERQLALVKASLLLAPA